MSPQQSKSGCFLTRTHVRKLLKLRDAAYRAGDTTAYSLARANLKRGIKAAKQNHKLKIEDNFNNNNPRRMWQGIQAITDYKTKDNLPVTSDPSLAEDLNLFFARFDGNDCNREVSMLRQDFDGLTLSTDEVRRALHRVNGRKAAGPDGVLGRVLRACTNHLTEVFTSIFNLSLTLAVVPTCLKVQP